MTLRVLHDGNNPKRVFDGDEAWLRAQPFLSVDGANYRELRKDGSYNGTAMFQLWETTPVSPGDDAAVLDFLGRWMKVDANGDSPFEYNPGTDSWDDRAGWEEITYGIE